MFAMKKNSLIFLLALTLAACVQETIDSANHHTEQHNKIINTADNAAPGILIVRLADASATLHIEDIKLDIEPIIPKTTGNDKLDRTILVRFDKECDLKSMAEAIAKQECVECVEYDTKLYRIESQSIAMPIDRPEPTRSVEYPFNDPELPWQWHYYNDASLGEMCVEGADINLLDAWKYTAGDNRVIVAVMDGGIMYNHQDLAANMWVNEAEKSGLEGVDDDSNGYVDDIHGYNFVDQRGSITADDHGTHVAGTIGAVNNNGYAVCGIAGGTGNGDGVRLMSLQIFKNDDGCYSHQIAQAYHYAADNGAVLINNSWGYEPGVYASDADFEAYDSVLKAAIDYFEENAGLEGVMDGGLSIYAAGNEQYPESAYPGAYHKYTCVTAMASDYTAAYYTNYGPGCNIAAPGGDACYGTIYCISSTSTDRIYGYEYMQGTSMATPHVTGCAALAISYALERGYTLTTEKLRNLILTSTHDINAYQVGTKLSFDYSIGEFFDMALDGYPGKLGSGYIDAHLMLMQMDGTPCLYLSTGDVAGLSLDAFFGGGSEDLTYLRAEISDEDKKRLGVTAEPYFENGMLRINCTNRGSARISVTAIVGGTSLGGGNEMGGMEVTREFEIVVRRAKAENGGWL